MLAVLDEDNHVHVYNVNSENVEELAYRDRVVKMSLGYDHLIVVTSSQCHINNIVTWGTPISFDIKDTVNLVVQSDR